MNRPAWRAKRQALFAPALLAGMMLLLLAACSGGQGVNAPASPSPEPSSTPRPTKGPPTVTYTPFDIEQIVPVSTPARSWEGLPIMPGALTGSGDEAGYAFTVRATGEDVRDFYLEHLPDFGWQHFGSGAGDPNPALMIFMKGSETLTVSYFPRDDGLLVLLVR